MGLSVVVFGRGLRGGSGGKNGVGDETGRGEDRCRVGRNRVVVGNGVVGTLVLVSGTGVVVVVVGRSSAVEMISLFCYFSF